MDTKALKESLKERLMNRQTYNSKLEQIKSITSLEIERQSIQDLKSIQENQFQSIHSESSQPRSIRKEESFLLNEINENLKWKQK